MEAFQASQQLLQRQFIIFPLFSYGNSVLPWILNLLKE
jgi:hypothetical protein